MAQPGQTTIQLYATSTAAATPSSANLVSGELALNLTDKKVFTKDGSGNVVEMTPSPTNALVVASGGTGATSAASARTNLDALAATNPSYTGTLTGGTGVINIGSGQLYKDAAGNLGLGVTPSYRMHAVAATTYVGFWRNTATSTGVLVGGDANGGIVSSDSSGTALQLQIGGATKATLDASGNLTPGADNTQTNGSGAKRWSTVYAGTGTINTSDAREKTPVRVMAVDEIEAAKALSKEIGVYQFLDSVAVKGDKARHHIGMTVQRAIQIMEAHGLSPFAYGFICYDKWGEQVTEHPAIEARAAVEAKAAVIDAEGNVIEQAVEAQPAIEAKAAWTEVTLKAGDRFSFRYDQLTLFIARGIHARLEALEAK